MKIVEPLNFETLSEVLHKQVEVTVKDKKGNRATFSGELTGVDGVEPEGIELDDHTFRFPLSVIVQVGVLDS